MPRFSDTQALVAYAMRVLDTSPQAAAIVHAAVPYSLHTHNSLGRMLGAVKAIGKGGGRADAQGQHGALASARALQPSGTRAASTAARIHRTT